MIALLAKSAAMVKVGPPDENTVIINHLDKLDICRCVIDLDNVERVVGTDAARSRFQSVQVFTI